MPASNRPRRGSRGSGTNSKTSASKNARRAPPNKKKAVPAKRKRSPEEEEGEDYDSDPTVGVDEPSDEELDPEDAELDPKEVKDLEAKDTKIAELEAQLKIAQGTAKIVPYGLTTMRKEKASRTYANLMRTHLVDNWWGLQPFINSDKVLDRVAVRLYKLMMSKEDKMIQEEVAKKQAQDTWIALHRIVIRQLFNDIRNYYQGRLRSIWMDHAGVELKKVSKEDFAKAAALKDKDGKNLGLVDKDGNPTPKFIPTIKSIITWDECLKVVARDAAFLKTTRGQFVADWWWSDAMRKLAGRTHWGDNRIHSNLISKAMLPKNDFWGAEYPAVPYQLEAAGILFMENAATKWPEFLVEKFKDPKWEYNPKAEYMNCPYSSSTEGTRNWGAFTVDGLKRYQVLRDIAKAGRDKKTCEDSEKAILKRLRVKLGLEDEQGNSLKKGSRKKKAKVADPVEDVELGDDDIF